VVIMTVGLLVLMLSGVPALITGLVFLAYVAMWAYMALGRCGRKRARGGG
jgi:hypothetical protein